MFESQPVHNPVAEAAIRRRAEWERERIERIWRMVDRGELTTEEAMLRLEGWE
jgi:hypothetical protein